MQELQEETNKLRKQLMQQEQELTVSRIKEEEYQTKLEKTQAKLDFQKSETENVRSLSLALSSKLKEHMLF